MKIKLTLSVFLIGFIATIYSQQIPILTSEGKNLKLSSLSVNVEVVGNKATTTYDMKFLNKTNRRLEGELSFPLGEGQQVSHLALEINGHLRDAVIVEKEFGRVAFENTVRQNIDPTLLEKTKGNNYKVRVYPIEPNSLKRVVLSYEQELFYKSGNHFYLLPLNFKHRLDKFSFAIDVLNQSLAPKIKSPFSKVSDLKEWKSNYNFSFNESNFLANEPIEIQIPVKNTKHQVLKYKDYIYAYTVLNPKTRIKPKSKNLTIFWDVSNSLRYKRLEKELELLDIYMNYLQDVSVRVVTFSNDIIEDKSFVVKKGNWMKIKELLKSSVYDGGTNYNAIMPYLDSTEENLLFSDGINTLSNLDFELAKPIYIINSLVSANHSKLVDIANKVGGNYINLTETSVNSALELLKNQNYKFLGVKNIIAGEKVEFYPEKGSVVIKDFSFSGKGLNKLNFLELTFGYGSEVTEVLKVELPKKSTDTKSVERIWAQKKLDFLSKNEEQNKNQIVELSKKHHFISSFTSLIVLDRVEDYVRYKIKPPTELLEVYNTLLTEAENTNKEEDIDYLKEELYDEYEDLLQWWAKEFRYVKQKKQKKKKKITSKINNAQQPSQQSLVQSTGLNEDYGSKLVSGTITDSSGGLPGVSVIIKGTTMGTETDFDGNYSIRVNEGDELQFSFVGMATKESRVGVSNKLDVRLEADSVLDEVVVIAQGIQTESRSLGYSVAQSSLQGKAAGVKIINSSGKTGASSKINVRGNTSISGNNQPLYIVDGIPSEGVYDLTSEDIEQITVIKETAAASLYGARAANGVVVITTKKGLADKKETIQAFNKELNDKIEFKAWNPETPYLKILEKAKSINEAYTKYLQLKQDYSNVPAFYIDVADFFEKRNDNMLAIRVLTNLSEIDIDNYELLRTLAYKLEYFNEHELAAFIYKEILRLRPEDIQSYRDLALAYEEIGVYQKSLELLFAIVKGDYLEKDVDRRFEGIEEVAYNELNSLITRHKSVLDLSKVDKQFVKEIPVDIRAVIDWNHNDTDIDLYVTDPIKEVSSYKNHKTKIGGRLSDDMTEGFGPEEFILKKAMKGNYEFEIDYYSDALQKISGPTFLKATLYTNFGRKNQKKVVKVIRLSKEDDTIKIGNIKI